MEGWRIRPAGDRALLIDLEGIDDAALHQVSDAVGRLPGVAAAIPGHQSVLALLVQPDRDLDPLRQRLESMLPALHPSESGPSGAFHEIGVDFSPASSPDLERLLSKTGMSRDRFLREVPRLRLRARYLGFLAGFAYLEGIPEEWTLPRLASPRTRVPGGSFGIAGSMAGFYPSDSPGGWNLIGRTLLQLWDPDADPPNRIAPGDEIRILPSDLQRGLTPLQVFLQTGLTPLQVAREIVEVIDPGQVTLLVRCPSLGRYRYGLAPGGPFDVEAAMSANRAAGNAPDAPLLECTLVGPTLRFHEPLILSWYGAEARIRIEGSMVETPYQFRVEAGQTLEVGALVRGARGWLALQGGLLDPAPRHVIFPTRVAAGQIIHVQRASDATARIKNLVRESPLLIRALPGPHPIDPRLLEQIAERAWRVTPILDRTGIRLESERLSYEPPSLLPSCPMQFGTVQWHPNGELVIMGPDHPVTGGYLQVLTVLSSELWKLAQLRPGDEIRWEIGGGGDGRGKRI